MNTILDFRKERLHENLKRLKIHLNYKQFFLLLHITKNCTIANFKKFDLLEISKMPDLGTAKEIFDNLEYLRSLGLIAIVLHAKEIGIKIEPVLHLSKTAGAIITMLKEGGRIRENKQNKRYIAVTKKRVDNVSSRTFNALRSENVIILEKETKLQRVWKIT